MLGTTHIFFRAFFAYPIPEIANFKCMKDEAVKTLHASVHMSPTAIIADMRGVDCLSHTWYLAIPGNDIQKSIPRISCSNS